VKTLLAIIGALALIIIILFAAIVVVGVQQTKPLMDEAHAYANESIEAIGKAWEGDEFWARSSPEMQEALDRAQADQLMSSAAFQLGALVKNNGAACQITQFEYGTDGVFATAQCTGVAEFQKAHADYLLNIVKRKDEWKIYGFFVLPGEDADGAVTVAYEPAPFRPSSIAFSWKTLSAGVSSGDRLTAGASVNAGAKVENVE